MQVYRVVTSMQVAASTLAHNWAVKIQCFFVVYFTVLIVAILYFDMRKHFDDDAREWCKIMLYAVEILN